MIIKNYIVITFVVIITFCQKYQKNDIFLLFFIIILLNIQFQRKQPNIKYSNIITFNILNIYIHFLFTFYIQISEQEDDYDREQGESITSEDEISEEGSEDDQFASDIVDDNEISDDPNVHQQVLRELQEKDNNIKYNKPLITATYEEQLKSKYVILEDNMSNCFRVKVRRGKQYQAVYKLTQLLIKQQIEYRHGLTNTNIEVFSVMTDLNDPEFIFVEAFDILTVERAVSLIQELIVPYQHAIQRSLVVKGKRKGINQNRIIQLSREAEQQTIFTTKNKLLKNYYLMRNKTKSGTKQVVVRVLNPNTPVSNEVEILMLSPYISLVSEEQDPLGITKRFGIEQYEQFASKDDYYNITSFGSQQYLQGLLLLTVKYNKLQELRGTLDEQKQISQLQLEGQTSKVIRLNESLQQLDVGDKVRVIGDKLTIGKIIKNYGDYTYKIQTIENDKTQSQELDRVERSQLIRHFDNGQHVKILDNDWTGIIVNIQYEDADTKAFILLDRVEKTYNQPFSMEQLIETTDIFGGEICVSVESQLFQCEQLIKSEVTNQLGLIIYICAEYAQIVTDTNENVIVNLEDFHKYDQKQNKIFITNQGSMVGRDSIISWKGTGGKVIALAESTGNKRLCWVKLTAANKRVFQCLDVADIEVIDIGDTVKRFTSRNNSTMIGQKVQIISGLNSGKIGIVKEDDGQNYKVQTFQGNTTVKIKDCKLYTKEDEAEYEREVGDNQRNNIQLNQPEIFITNQQNNQNIDYVDQFGDQ